MRFLLLLLVCVGLHAEPIEFVVSASAGGPNDTATRKIVEKLEKTKLDFIILNKPGASHSIAYNYVLNSNKPTLLLSTPEILSHDVIGFVDDIFNVGHFTNIVFVSEKSGIKNLKDLSKLPREINFGHGGKGTNSYMAMESLCNKRLRCLDVPYKSGAEGMMGVLTGTIDAFALASYGTKQFIENDRYTVIHVVRFDKNKSWFKLFAKNLSEKDKELIMSTLKMQDTKFYSEMGFEK